MPAIPSPYRLAINIHDVSFIPLALRRWLLSGKVDLKAPVWPDRSVEGSSALVFTCDLLTAACACDLLRAEARALGFSYMRVYLYSDFDEWTRLPGYAVLVNPKENGAAGLSAEWFPLLADPVKPATPLPAQKLL